MNSADSGNMLLLLSAVDQSMNDSVNANSEPPHWSGAQSGSRLLCWDLERFFWHCHSFQTEILRTVGGGSTVYIQVVMTNQN